MYIRIYIRYLYLCIYIRIYIMYIFLLKEVSPVPIIDASYSTIKKSLLLMWLSTTAAAVMVLDVIFVSLCIIQIL